VNNGAAIVTIEPGEVKFIMDNCLGRIGEGRIQDDYTVFIQANDNNSVVGSP